MTPIRIPNAEGIAAMTPRQRKSLEVRLRNTAQRQSKLLVKSRRRDPYANDYGLYVLVEDTPENRRIGAQAPLSAFARGEGTTLDGIARKLFGQEPAK